MNLKGTTILYTDLVFDYQRTSYLVLDYHGRKMLVIEELSYSPGNDRYVGQVIDKLSWHMSDWEKHGWEVIPPS